MRASQINLKQEVTRNDAMIIANWLNNHEVIKYLNEANNIVFEIQQAVYRVNMLVMTQLFNREGSFYLIYKDDNEPIGFMKLLRRQGEAEIVIVIGDKRNWGKGIGKEAIKRGLDIAFFQWRVPCVIAKINSHNSRSIKAFESSGFLLETEHENMKKFSLSMEDYMLKLTKNNVIFEIDNK